MIKPSSRRLTSKSEAFIAPARWAAYATAGAATAMVGTPSAEADIHHVEVDTHFSGFGHGSRNGDLRNFPLEPGAYLTFLHGANMTDTAGIAGFYFGTLGNIPLAQFAAQAGTYNGNPYHYVSKLSFGQNISTRPFLGNVGIGHYAPLASGAGYPKSQWTTAGTGFMAFKFDIGMGVQYGWARITMDGPNLNTFTLVDYAFADPGETLVAGQVPEPGSLVLLSLGAVGLLAWRKARAKANIA